MEVVSEPVPGPGKHEITEAEQLITDLPVAIYSCDKEGYIVHYNKAAVVLWGREPVAGREQWCGSLKVYALDGTPIPLDSCPMALSLYEGKPVADREIVVERPDGTRRHVKPHPRLLFDAQGNISGAVNMVEDVTGQKTIEEALIKSKEEAERSTNIAEVAQRKAEAATRIAEEAVKAKQRFLSNMSHEIRTPMNAIIGFTRLLLKTKLSAKQQEYLAAIKVSGDSLIVVINDILDLAKVDAGKMSFAKSPFKLFSSFESMLHLFEVKIQEKNLALIKNFDHRIPNVLLGDQVRLHQIILNLLSNAVKFTAEGSIAVSVTLEKETDKDVTIQFSVKDTGIGIPEAKTGKIFENFEQAYTDTSRVFGGTGLGLAIVKQLVESQGGTIEVTSAVGEGADFMFTLTFLKTDQDAEMGEEAMELDKSIKNIRVLVAEDIELNQLLMKSVLDDFGFERDIASNGQIAIDMLRAKSYDIILMDLQMPVMNGIEATEYIRNTFNSKIPIIALTADVTTIDLEKCKAAGMNDYLSKPVDEKVLYQKIVGLVKKKPKPRTKATDDNALAPDPLIPGEGKFTDLRSLTLRTKADPLLMCEMISIYLRQEPPLLLALQKGLETEDWQLVESCIHKMIPSFSILGMGSDLTNTALQLQEKIAAKETEQLDTLVNIVINAGKGSCTEFEKILEHLKTQIHEK